MVNVFIGWEQDALEAALRTAQEEYFSGKITIEVNAGDAGTKKMVTVNVQKRLEQLLYALYLLDPGTYPLEQIRRVTRTRLQIYGGCQ